MRLFCVAALALGTPFAVHPATASTDTAVRLPQRPVAGIRILGRWGDGAGVVYTFEHDGLRTKGRAVRRSSGEVLATFELSPHPIEGVRGPFQDRANGQTGFVSAYHNGHGPVLFVREGVFLGRKAQTGLTLLPIDQTKVDSAWLGSWRTTRGLFEISPEQKVLAGRVQSERSLPRFVALIPEGSLAYGGWEGDGSGDVELRLAPDGRSFRGWYTDLSTGGSRVEWTGGRIVASTDPAPPREPAPAGDNSLPGSPSAPAPAPAPTPSPAPAPAGEAGFKPLRQFDVRLDRLWEARGYPTRQVHAFVTIKNVSARPQYITSGFLKAVLTDSDGVAQENGQVWRASAEPAALFNATPVVQPGGELKIRYVFSPDAGATPERLTLTEGDRRAEFQASAL